MTVQAALTEQVLRRRAGRETSGILGDARMPALRMTALAEQRRPAHQHSWLIRTMGVVTGGAVLGDRCVLPQEWTALFGVTLITGVVDRLTDEHHFRGRAVWAVTPGASHLSLARWMRICFQRIALSERMTLKALSGLR